jgi:hypothetical protein
MSRDTFNEAERFLISNWVGARQLELSMEKVREKYVAVVQRVVDTVRGRHENLDVSTIKVTQHWGNGYVGLGRKAWHSERESPTGYYIENIRLELLADESVPPPTAYIWLKPAVQNGADLARALAAVRKAAAKALSKDELRACQFMDDDETVLSLGLLPGRKDLLAMLSQADSQAFVDCLVSQFEILTRFSEVLDSVLINVVR